jgi:hypothetical protein
MPGYKPYKTLELDTLKLYTLAHGHKVSSIFLFYRPCSCITEGWRGDRISSNSHKIQYNDSDASG